MGEGVACEGTPGRAGRDVPELITKDPMSSSLSPGLTGNEQGSVEVGELLPSRIPHIPEEHSRG